MADASLPARSLLPIAPAPSAGMEAREAIVTDPEMGTGFPLEGGVEEHTAPDIAMSEEAVHTRGADMAVGGEGVIPGAILLGGGEANPVVADDSSSRGGAEGVTDPKGGGSGGEDNAPPATPPDGGAARSVAVAGSRVHDAIDEDAARVAQEATAGGAMDAAASMEAPVIEDMEAAQASLRAAAGGATIGSTAVAEGALVGDNPQV